MQNQQIEFLKEVVSSVSGKPTEPIVDLLIGKKNVNEFLIAKKLGLTINQTRNILYKLSDFGLVSSIRKKDKKKGWYTYFWKIEILKSLEFLKNALNKSIEQLTYHVKSRETKLFYVCERCNIELSDENALAHDFICTECGDVFTVKDNSKVLKDFKKEQENYRKELELVNQEIMKEKEKDEKEKLKLEKKEQKEKEIFKLKQKKARAREKKKLNDLGENKVKTPNKTKKIKKIKKHTKKLKIKKKKR